LSTAEKFDMGHRALAWQCDVRWALFSLNDGDGDAYESWLNCFAEVNAYENPIGLKVLPTGVTSFSYFESYLPATI
jgi:hypothetical protein